MNNDISNKDQVNVMDISDFRDDVVTKNKKIESVNPQSNVKNLRYTNIVKRKSIREATKVIQKNSINECSRAVGVDVWKKE